MRISAPLSFFLLPLCCLIPAPAAIITLGGDFAPAPVGALGPLAPGAVLAQPIPFQGAGNHFLSGTVMATNVGGTAISLTLTDLTYRSDVPGMNGGVEVSLTETIRLQQTFTVVPGNWMAEHAFDGTATFNLDTQTASIAKTSTHNGIALPDLLDIAFALNPPPQETVPLADGPSAPVNVPSGAVYTIDTTYTFSLFGGRANGDWVQINLSSSGVDDSAVPEPSAFLLLGTGLVLFACARSRCATLKEDAGALRGPSPSRCSGFQPDAVRGHARLLALRTGL